MKDKKKIPPFLEQYKSCEVCGAAVITGLPLFVCVSAEPGVKTGSSPGKIRRSPLQALYNGDQVRTHTPL